MNSGLIITVLALSIFFIVKVLPFLGEAYTSRMKLATIEKQIAHKKNWIIFMYFFSAVIYFGLFFSTTRLALSLMETGFYAKGAFNNLEALVGGSVMIVVFPFFFKVMRDIKKDELEDLESEAPSVKAV